MNTEVRVCFIIDKPGVSARAEGCVLWGWDLEFVEGLLRRAGIPRSSVAFVSLDKGIEQLGQFPNLRVVIPAGELALVATTGRKSISKWHLSPLDTLTQIPCRKAVPTWPLESVKKDFSLSLYVEMALKRAREECETELFTRKPKRFLLNPSLEETHAVLAELTRLSADDWLSVDIETGRGQINTVGFAWSASDAIAINVLPDRCGAEEYYRLWTRIRDVLRGRSRKIFQNGIYEVLYFARYGLSVENFAHDTMCAQKLLWPEFEKGLDNVGRFYTREPYWKDSGRVESEEGKRKDWGNIRDWPAHYNYNCLDTTGTYEAALGQRDDLCRRGILEFFDGRVMRVARLTQEMSLRGLPVCSATRDRLTKEYEEECQRLAASLSTIPVRKKDQVSYVTRAQKLKLLKDKGYSIPKKRDKETGAMKESADEESLKKILAKHPDDTDIPKLLKLAEYEKALSSYFRAELDPLDGFLRYAIDPLSTETMRMSCSLDPWGRGLNAQTCPGYVKEMLRWK